MKTPDLRGLLFLILLSAAASAAQGPAVSDRIEFNRDIRPILSDNCFYCHGNDPSHRKAKLRLDIREEALKKEAFVPGKSQESELVKRILTQDSDELMPPPDSHKKLSEADKAILQRWIDQGAEYQQHWSYEKPRKAAIPEGQNGVDFLVQNRLAARGLKPSPEADRRTLIRRLYLDLLGLPPSPAEVAAFVNDPSPNAYDVLLDRVLANPHFGERMALGWLDVVRFADTIGYHSDNPRNVWPYRDWVIRSFNENKRFDRFTIEQIAGDLLPDSNRQTKIASAFNRLLLTTEEGGAQGKDYEQRMLTDRVRAVGAAWLGQTTGCAQCHDHKFDPFTTRDFYTLGAFFSDIEERSVGRLEDGMLVGSPEELEKMEKLEAVLKEAKKNFEAIRPNLEAAQKEWENEFAQDPEKIKALRESLKSAAAPAADAGKKAADALEKELSARKDHEKKALSAYFQDHVTPLFADERSALKKAQLERDAYYDSLAKCLVTSSMRNKRTVRILPRGNWMDESGEVVKAALPHYLPQPEIKDRELTRLDLAQWLVSKDNPLTARTVMNRLWKQLFGIGLSKVLDDLGAQGELPPNQPLLDWLACEFMDSGWDMKHMVRTIARSATYRQASTATPELTAADPYNRELARQSPFRIDAELVRDNALAVSGLLVPKIGGPSVKPYQPDGYWENLNFPPRSYSADQGEAQHRRGLYVWWQRSFLHPSLLAFDAPSREESCSERNRSNIPQQALVLLNDPTYVEAARSLAARSLKKCSGDNSGRIAWIWEQVLQRKPSEFERSALEKLLQERLAAYQADEKAASALLRVGSATAPENVSPKELAA